MLRFLLMRLLWAAPIVLAIAVLGFLLLHLVRGDPVTALIGDFPAPPEYVARVRADFGLDQPLGTQLWLYLVNLAHGNLGFSFANRLPVLTLVLDRARITLLLMIPALVAASTLGVAMALAAAPRAGSGTDATITGLSLLGHAVPVFWLAQLLVMAFAVQLHWMPASGMISLRNAPTGWGAVMDFLWHLVLPMTCITIYYVAVVARVARAAVVELLHKDFVLTGMAKGLTRRRVLWRHILPNALIPVVTVVGYSFGSSLTGAILTETVFAWPGLGSLFVSSIASRDYPVMQGIFLFSAVAVVVANILTDFVYWLVDPRLHRNRRVGAANA
ncbi:MAG: ABC transporter permease [Alphaproteobacteria bacterium]|nr:ABC transporter permease [Alphaproteobacteria bacterium]